MEHNDLWIEERRLLSAGCESICGADEAGAGPLAGPVYAAAVILPRELQIEGLNDSKQLTAKKRDALFDEITQKALAYAMKDELLKGNLHNFGKLLDYGWESKKRMSSKISNPQIDFLYEEAKKAGALGGKLLGAGGGGFLLVYCPYNVKHRVGKRLQEAGGQLMDWNFELRGAQSWICNEERWQYREVSVQMPEKEYRFHL